MIEVGHGREQKRGRRQRAGNLWDEVWRICVEDGCSCFCEPIKGWSKSKETYFCLLIYKNCTYRGKMLELFFVMVIYLEKTMERLNSGDKRTTDVEAETYSPVAYPSVKTTEYSSSSWWSTSRRRWSDWIQEIKGWSSERIRVLSVLVWWCLEEYDCKTRRENKKRFQQCTDQFKTRNSFSPSSSRSFRTQSHWSFTTGQCTNSGQLSEYTYHIGCAINLHSIMNSGLIGGRGQNSSRERQTVFFSACESHGSGTQRSVWAWFDQTTSCIVQAE